MNPVPFQVVSEEAEPGIRILAVRGELDLNTAPEFEMHLGDAIENSSASIMVDLSDCEFIDSTGIALIVRNWQRLEDDGSKDRRLVLCCSNHQVWRLLKITGVEDSISMCAEREGAIAELRA